MSRQARPAWSSSDRWSRLPMMAMGPPANHTVSTAGQQISGCGGTETTSIDVRSAINAISSSPDQASIIVAGKDVLKIVRLNEGGGGMEDCFNLRVGRSNQTKNCTDVAWNPFESNATEIVTAAYNGHIVLWDLSMRAQEQKQKQVLHAHTRTVNSVRFHPSDPSTLLSGAQDSTVKRWDLRTYSESAAYRMNDSVKSATWDPLNPVQFAVALETGNVQIWDIRQPTTSVHKVQAHQGPAYTVDWHPSQRNRLATGGRDKNIHIWDFNAGYKGKESLVCTVQTIASVARVYWRPEHPTQVSSCSLVHDFGVHVWDLTRPYLPILSFERHRKEATDMIWDPLGQNVLLTCSKDHTLIRNVVKDAARPEAEASNRSSGVRWNIDGGLYCFNETGETRETLYDGPSVIASSPVRTPMQTVLHMLGGKQEEQGSSLRKNQSKLTIIKHVSGMDAFEALANGYLYRETGQSEKDICLRNAEVAENAGVPQISQTWRILAELQGMSGPSLGDEAVNGTQPSNDLTRGPSAGATSKNALGSKGADVGPTQPALSSGTLFKSDMESVTLASDFDDDQFTLQLLDEIDALRDEAINVHDSFSSSDADSQEEANSHTDEEIEPGDNADADIMLQRTAKSSAQSSKKVGLAVTHVELPRWESNVAAKSLLQFYAELGDVQMCASLVLVLGETFAAGVEEEQLTNWFWSYCDLLERRRLFVARTRIIKLCHLEEIREMNTDSTCIPLNCGSCQKPLTQTSWCCKEKCKTLTNTCSFCHLPVKALYAWCQVCGHGGHMKCMRDWFKSNRSCPTGCGHECEYT